MNYILNERHGKKIAVILNGLYSPLYQTAGMRNANMTLQNLETVCWKIPSYPDFGKCVFDILSCSRGY